MTSNGRRQVGLVIYRATTDLAGKGAFFLVTVVAARQLSQESFGVFSIGTTIGWMTAVAADFGIQLHLARALTERPDAALPLLRAWLRVRVWTAVVAIVAVGAGAWLLATPPALARVTVLFTLIYATNGLVEFLHYFYRGLGRTDVESTIVLAQRGAMLALALGALLWRPSVGLLGVAMLIPAAGALIVSLRMAVALGTQQSPEAPRANRRTMSGDALRDVLPIGVGIVLSTLYFRIDVFLIDAWVGTRGVALYSAVFRLVEALRLFPAAVIAVALPGLFRATTRLPLARVASWLTAGGVVVAAGVWWMADWVVPLVYGARYAPAVQPFRILALSFPLMSLNYALTHQLIGWHRHRLYAGLCALALAVNVALNAILVPSAGIEGAAWATLWTEAVITAGCALALARLTGTRPATSAQPQAAAS